MKISAVDPKKKSAMERKTKDFELLSEKANVDAEKVFHTIIMKHEKDPASYMLFLGGKIGKRNSRKNSASRQWEIQNVAK